MIDYEARVAETKTPTVDRGQLEIVYQSGRQISERLQTWDTRGWLWPGAVRALLARQATAFYPPSPGLLGAHDMIKRRMCDERGTPRGQETFGREEAIMIGGLVAGVVDAGVQLAERLDPLHVSASDTAAHAVAPQGV